MEPGGPPRSAQVIHLIIIKTTPTMKGQTFQESQGQDDRLVLPEPPATTRPFVQHQETFGKFVMEEEVEKGMHRHPDHVLFMEYGLSDLDYIANRCADLCVSNVEDDIKARALALREKAKSEINRRLDELMGIN